MSQATNLKNVVLPALRPGVQVNTSPTNYRPLTQVQLQKWEGRGLEFDLATSWELSWSHNRMASINMVLGNRPLVAAENQLSVRPDFNHAAWSFKHR